VRILLAAKYVPGASREIGGVQSWVATVAAELRRIGHDAVLWCPEWSLPAGRFDLGILANHRLTEAAVASCDQVMAVSHGIIDPECPPEDMPVVFTSEGVREYWGGDGPIIRQPIDLQFWSPGGDGSAGLVRYSYRGGLAWLSDVAATLGLPYRHLRGVSPQQARDVLRNAACVLASGRAAVEAMACGVPFVICDHRSAYQGPLLDVSALSMIRNYSGRGGVVPTPELVAAAVRGVIGKGGWREQAAGLHDVREIVPQLLEAACCTC
jgi:hypothetical protein